MANIKSAKKRILVQAKREAQKARPGTHTRHQTEYLRKHPLGDELRTSGL